ncbi:dienelactone hydrolase family protein [Phreatobacter sp.]|uniref:dienelactone hydrolase family protein n=1 Tax=Phreatobacter sp. TaxID=1966341 RepID=UPI0022BC4767|nr:dienelactone hydrolase family protein [Phreatobacter sp.]MCZ8313607.1 dienelactone hydrolase family protein [Phreatobacter sp.]
MRLRAMAAGLAMITVVGGAVVEASGSENRVTFPNASGVVITARLLLPAGTGPFPAVIALHGCGGSNDRSGALVARDRDWAERWVAAGHAVLLPDSFGSRGLGPQCSVADRTVRQSVERVDDTMAARAFLQARSDIRGDALTLVGWSNGAGTALYAISARKRPADGRPDFRGAIAFYPGCRNVLARDITPRLPLTILIGDADNWTPPGPCRDYVAMARASGAIADIVTYPGAYHGFDAPSSPIRERRGLAFTADGSGRAMVGTDPAARADAISRVAALLAR